jgi:hypothetical protein
MRRREFVVCSVSTLVTACAGNASARQAPNDMHFDGTIDFNCGNVRCRSEVVTKRFTERLIANGWESELAGKNMHGTKLILAPQAKLKGFDWFRRLRSGLSPISWRTTVTIMGNASPYIESPSGLILITAKVTPVWAVARAQRSPPTHTTPELSGISRLLEENLPGTRFDALTISKVGGSP